MPHDISIAFLAKHIAIFFLPLFVKTWKANWFAAEFLTPANMIREDYKKFGGEVRNWLIGIRSVDKQCGLGLVTSLVKEQVP